MDALLAGMTAQVPTQSTGASALSGAHRRGGGTPDNAEAARQIEGLFLGEMIKAMRKSVPKDGMMSGGRGEEVMQSFQDEALAQAMAARGGLGLAAHLLRAMDRADGTLAPQPENGAATNGKALQTGQ